MAHPATARSSMASVLLFDFGAQVAGYRSDMTRTLFVGEPSARDLEIYELVAQAQAAAIAAIETAVALQGPDGTLPSGRTIDGIARDVIVAAGHGDHFGHGTGHGIGLATHEMPSLGRLAAETPAAEPDGLLGRARDLSRWARWASGSRTSSRSTRPSGRVERLTRFPREVIVVGGLTRGRRGRRRRRMVVLRIRPHDQHR